MMIYENSQHLEILFISVHMLCSKNIFVLIEPHGGSPRNFLVDLYIIKQIDWIQVSPT